MSIDYYASYPCAVREVIDNDDLLRMEKARNRAQCVANLLRDNPDTPKDLPESEWTFMVNVMRPEGLVQTEVKIGDLLSEAAPLTQLSTHCQGCPGNFREVDFGCGGAINFPISAKAEQWLIDRLPDDLQSPPGILLQAALKEGFDGSNTDQARQRKELYDSATPATRKWGGFFSKKTHISSSQILDMIIPVGHLQPTHMKLLAYFLGYLDSDFQYSQRADNYPQASDDACTEQFKAFLLAATQAAVNDIPVYMDT